MSGSRGGRHSYGDKRWIGADSDLMYVVLGSPPNHLSIHRETRLAVIRARTRREVVSDLTILMQSDIGTEWLKPIQELDTVSEHQVNLSASALPSRCVGARTSTQPLV